MKDLVIVGAGLAGLSAAVSASERRLDVLCLEAADSPGGLSARSSGFICAVDPLRMRSMGLYDNPEDHLRITMQAGGGRSRRELAETLVYDAAGTITWLEAHGVEFDEKLHASARSFFPRGHTPGSGQGAEYVQKLYDEARFLGVEFRFSSPVEKIVRSEDGSFEVFCASAGGAGRVEARSVLVAAGTYAVDRRRLLLEDPRLRNAKIAPSPASACSGLVLLEELGVQTVHLSHSFKLLLARGGRPLPAFFRNPAGVIIVDESGRRMVQEDLRESNLVEELLNRMKSPRFFMLGTPDWMSRDEGRPLEEIARIHGIDAEGLGAAIAEYNRAAAGGAEDEFGRRPQAMRPLNPDVLVCIEGEITVLTTTGGGLITRSGQAVSRSGEPIDGLYIAGDSAGGIHGRSAVYGNMLLAAAFYGRMAGLSAASALSR